MGLHGEGERTASALMRFDGARVASVVDAVMIAGCVGQTTTSAVMRSRADSRPAGAHNIGSANRRGVAHGAPALGGSHNVPESFARSVRVDVGFAAMVGQNPLAL